MCDSVDDSIKEMHQEKKSINPDELSSTTDLDPVSYISILIIQFSRFLTGECLSQRGVNSLLLFLLTGTLLFSNTDLPDNNASILKIYWFPLLFLISFLIEAMRLNTWVNNKFRRIFQKTDYAYNKIISGDISQDDLDFFMYNFSFNKKHLSSIVSNLMENDLFSTSIQNWILQNKSNYKIELIKYLKKQLLNHDWSSVAVCSLVKRTEGRLTQSYADKLLIKYEKYPSVCFAVGYYQNNTSNEYSKLGNDFDYNQTKIISLIDVFRLLTIVTGILLLFALSTEMYFQIFKGVEVLNDEPFLRVLATFVVLFASFALLNDFKVRLFKRNLKKYVDQNLKEDNNDDERKNIVNDLVNAY